MDPLMRCTPARLLLLLLLQSREGPPLLGPTAPARQLTAPAAGVPTRGLVLATVLDRNFGNQTCNVLDLG